jgi:hypothetical protein
VDAHLERLEVEAVRAGDHELAVEHAARRQLRAERLAQLGEVAVERLLVAALEQQLVAVAEHEHAEAVPLRLEDPARAVGQRVDALGEHRQDRRVDGELHARILSRVAHRVFLLSPRELCGQARRAAARALRRFRACARACATAAHRSARCSASCRRSYFRGKLGYAERFAAPPPAVPGVLVITAGRGLVAPTPWSRSPTCARSGACRSTWTSAAMPSRCERRRRIARAGAPPRHAGRAAREHRHREVRRRARSGVRRSLLFPSDFVGRGDMSRGGLCLRAAKAGVELAYARSTAPCGAAAPAKLETLGY